MNSEIQDRFGDNIARVRHLVAIYVSTRGHRRGRSGVDVSDVLRSAVVLLHAAVEDMLRSLERRTLPTADRDLLDPIPLVGTPTNSRYFLGALVPHRDKTVSALIEESVAAYLQRSTYNNTRDVVAAVVACGGNLQAVQGYLPDLDAMMTRRHSIVHRADRQERRGSGFHKARSIAQSDVVGWTNVAEEFGRAVFRTVPDLRAQRPNGR